MQGCMSQETTAAGVPGGVYLCQINESVSCGACCGLYNVPDPTRNALRNMLLRRTEIFARTSRELQAILDFCRREEQNETQNRPFPEFHHCPFLGLIGENRSRVGCLLHPSVKENRDIDYRGLSYYGAMACRVYFCQSYHRMTRQAKEVVTRFLSNWYAYGMVVTEWRLVNGIFSELARRLDREITVDDFFKNTHAIRSFQDLMVLKLEWPFRENRRTAAVHYLFEDEPHASRPSVNYTAVGAGSSRYDGIFRELCSFFPSREALCRAEKILEDMLGIVCLAVEGKEIHHSRRKGS